MTVSNIHQRDCSVIFTTQQEPATAPYHYWRRSTSKLLNGRGGLSKSMPIRISEIMRDSHAATTGDSNASNPV